MVIRQSTLFLLGVLLVFICLVKRLVDPVGVSLCEKSTVEHVHGRIVSNRVSVNGWLSTALYLLYMTDTKSIVHRYGDRAAFLVIVLLLIRLRLLVLLLRTDIRTYRLWFSLLLLIWIIFICQFRINLRLVSVIIVFATSRCVISSSLRYGPTIVVKNAATLVVCANADMGQWHLLMNLF